MTFGKTIDGQPVGADYGEGAGLPRPQSAPAQLQGGRRAAAEARARAASERIGQIGDQAGTEDVLSPIARAIIQGRPFAGARGLEVVEARHGSSRDVISDVLVVRGRCEGADGRLPPLAAIQIRDLERMIKNGQVVVPHRGCASEHEGAGAIRGKGAHRGTHCPGPHA